MRMGQPFMSGQSKGGIVRAESLSTEQRREIATKAARARWAKIKDPNSVTEAVTDGTLKIGDVELDVYVLKDRRRVISMRAMGRALGMKSEGGNIFARTMARKGVRSALSEKLADSVENPIYFKPLMGDLAYGMDAESFIEICDALLDARASGSLQSSQQFLAIQAEIIIRSAAKVGITALIDEATGFVDKTKDEYRKLFDAFIRREFRQWDLEFPDKFFDMIYRLYGLKRQKPSSTKHPRFFSQFIRKYIYYPLANSNGVILEKLEEQNPVVYDNGGRKFKLFQFLTDKVGMAAFRQHLWQVVGIGEASQDKVQFDRGFYRAFPEARPRKGDERQLDLFKTLNDDA